MIVGDMNAKGRHQWVEFPNAPAWICLRCGKDAPIIDCAPRRGKPEIYGDCAGTHPYMAPSRSKNDRSREVDHG